MDGGVFKPYRQPCGISFGNNCYSHAKAADYGINRYTNVTTVPAPGGSGPAVTPYERYAPDSGGDCETFNCDPSTSPCTSWIGGGINQYVLISGAPTVAPITWHHTAGDTVNFAVCQKQGFKNVAAQRIWQGTFGWVDAQGDCFTTPCFDAGAAADGHSGFLGAWGHSGYVSSAPQTKFLVETLTVSGVRSVTPDGGDTTSQTQGGSCTCSIDANSGMVSISGSYDDSDTGGLDTTNFVNFVTEGGYNTFLGYFGTFLSELSVPDTGTTYFTSSSGMAGTIYGYHQGGSGDYQYESVAINPPSGGEPGSCERFMYNPDGTWFWHETLALGNNSVTYTWEYYVHDGDEHVTTDDYISVELAYSGENTAATAWVDLQSLLGKWDMANDHVYPWRTSGLLSVAPLVSRNEKTGNFHLISSSDGFTVDDYSSPIGDPPYSSWDQMDWFDPAGYVWQFPAGEDQTTAAGTLVQIFDGSVLGAPLTAGYENFFCWQFEDWHGCKVPDAGFDFWRYGWGMFLEDYNSQVGGDLPETSTQWTNNFFTIGTPPGACIAYNDPTLIGMNNYSGRAGAGGLVAYKYAEILDRWPSQNFGRPSGPDKFAYDETLVYCLNDLSGSGTGATFALTNWDGASITLTDTSGAWGGASVGGFFNISQSGGTITLGTKVYDLPSNWVSRSGDDAQCFGKLRFDGCASLRGRQAITVSGMTITFNEAQPQFGLASATHHEQVDIYDASYTLLATNVTATRVNDSSFTTVTAYPTATWVTNTGVKYYFDDEFPKGDFAILQWLFDYRTNGERGRLVGEVDCSGTQIAQPAANYGYAAFQQDARCLSSQPCTPAVVCFTPNGETFANGIIYGFPSTFVMDEQYGSCWQGYVQQTMTDLFWQKPHLPCGALSLSILADPGDTVDGSAISWVMDNGTCEADSFDEETGLQTMYFPLAPQVEARLTLPANYGAAQNETPPSLPGGITIGWLSPVDHNNGDVAYPPGYIGFNLDGTPASLMTPWVLHSLLCAAIDPESTCRFKGTYQEQVVDCA